MSDDISITEAKNILERLVNERKALAKGLEVASKLADIEQTTQERQTHLDSLIADVERKAAELKDIEKNISAVHKRREEACVKREVEAEAKVLGAQTQLDSLLREFASKKASFDEELETMQLQRFAAAEEHQKLIVDLRAQVESLKSELKGLNAKARALAGV
jgi:chromosome segregation ATPase